MNAADVMTRTILSVTPETGLPEAVRLMLEHNISGLPVIEASGKLVGMLTEGDLLRRAETGTDRRRPQWLEFLLGGGKLAGEYVRTHGRKVEELMTCDVVSVGETAPLGDVVRKMERHRIKRIPVLRDGKVVGIISRANLVRALASIASELPAPGRDDAKIHEAIVAELAKQPWAPPGSANIVVRNGVAHLWGVILDEEQRRAMRVVAENVPGVTAVEDHLVWVEPLSGFVIGPAEIETEQQKEV